VELWYKSKTRASSFKNPKKIRYRGTFCCSEIALSFRAQVWGGEKETVHQKKKNPKGLGSKSVGCQLRGDKNAKTYSSGGK